MTRNRPACNLGTALFPRGGDSVSGRPHHEALRLLYERDSILPLELSGLMWHRPSVANSVAVVGRVTLASTVNASLAWDGRTPTALQTRKHKTRFHCHESNKEIYVRTHTSLIQLIQCIIQIQCTTTDLTLSINNIN